MPGSPATLIALEGAFNFRDLGGLPVRGGGVTREGRLFRSDTLQALSATDVDRLSGTLGLRSVIDLRLQHEVAEQGRGPLAQVPTIRYFNAPLGMASIDGVPSGQVLSHLYTSCVESASLAAAVIQLAEVVENPCLFHCAAGKDRTGVLAAITLGLVGVGDDAIVDDYLRSGANMARIVDRFRNWPRYREHIEAMPPEVYRVDAKSILDLLETVRARYGGAEGWAAHMGVPATSLAALRQHLVTPTAEP